jgi:acetyl esterase/lipase
VLRAIASAPGVLLAIGTSRLTIGAEAAPTKVEWSSETTGQTLGGLLRLPKQERPEAPLPTVIYLKNLSIPRLGRDGDAKIVDDLVRDGHLVLELDYAKHANAVGPTLQADVLKLRQEVSKQKLLAEHKVDPAHLFILPEGFRLKRDLEFARDGKRVLGMDVMYPAGAASRVPVLMEFTCDNANRMGNGSLVFCHDTLIEGAMFAGFAAAMADHPVAPPYKGLDDPMPQVIHRLKAAVRTLRAAGDELGLSGKVGVMGFSRGSNMAALLATTGGIAELEGEAGRLHPDVSSRIQAAMAHGGRFDFINLRGDDPMLARYAKAWGPRETSAERWAAHGALHYLGKGEPAAPMFLNTSNAESPEFRDGLALLAKRLEEAGVECVYSEDADGRGHRVSTDPKTLAAAYAFFAKHLKG